MLGYIALSAILHDQLQGIVRAIANQYAFRLLKIKREKERSLKSEKRWISGLEAGARGLGLGSWAGRRAKRLLAFAALGGAAPWTSQRWRRQMLLQYGANTFKQLLLESLNE